MESPVFITTKHPESDLPKIGEQIIFLKVSHNSNILIGIVKSIDRQKIKVEYKTALGELREHIIYVKDIVEYGSPIMEAKVNCKIEKGWYFKR